MFHRIESVNAVDSMILKVSFRDGAVRLYDIRPLESEIPAFSALRNDELFSSVHVSNGGYGLIWSKDLDLSAEEVWLNGKALCGS